MSPLLQTPLSIEHALLGLVRRRPAYGYEIHHQLMESPDLRLVWRIKQGRLYALLTRLEGEGLLSATLEPQDSRPPRKVYHLTSEGERAFGRWLTQPVRLPREMRLEFMLKLYFAREEGVPVVAQLVQRQREVCVRWLSEWRADDELSAFNRAVRRYRQGHIEAIGDWLASLAAEYAASDRVVP